MTLQRKQAALQTATKPLLRIKDETANATNNPIILHQSPNNEIFFYF